MERTFGQTLAMLRADKGWTQDELASAAGINRPRISLLENDEVDKPRANTLRKIAKALGVPVQRLEGRALTPLPSPPTDPQPPSVVAMQASTSELDATNMTARYIRALEEEVAWLRESLGKPWGSQQAAERQPYMQVA